MSPADPTSHTAQVPTSADMNPTEVVHAVMRLWRTIKYRRNTVFMALAMTTVLGITYYITAPRYYRSTAKLLINENKSDETTSLGDQIANENLMANQRETLLSPKVISKALSTLKPIHQIDLRNKPTEEWERVVGNRLSAKASHKGSFLEVSYTSLEAEAAAGMVTAIVDSYLTFVDVNHKGMTGQRILQLEQDKLKTETAIDENHRALELLQARVGHLGGGDETAVIDPAIMRAQKVYENVLRVQQRLYELRAHKQAVSAAEKSGQDLRQYLALLEESVGEQFLSSSLGLTTQDLETIRQREEELEDARTELRNLLQYLGPNNNKVLELQAKIDGLNQYLGNYRAQASQRMRGLTNSDLAPLLLSMLDQAVDRARHEEAAALAAYNSARAEVTQHNKDVYEIETRSKDADRLQLALDDINAKLDANLDHQRQGPIQVVIVKDALPDFKPVSPKLKVIGVLSLLGGLMIGTLLAYVQDVLDDRFNSPEELSQQLQVPVLAVIHNLDPLPGEGLQSVHTHMRPNATDSEAFRTLRTSIALNSDVSDRIMISSSEPGDGKTTVSANLAVAFAQAGKKTLVIDADLRRPGMTALLSLKGVPGVVDLLSGDKPIAEAAPKLVLDTDAPGLHVIPAGLRRPNPAELLASQSFIELLAWADSQYDQVLVDCPPVLAVSDAQIVGRLVDGAVLVVRPEKNHRRLVTRACESFRSTGTQVFGVVANDVSKSDGSGYGYGYGYGYNYGGDDDSHDIHDDIVTLDPEGTTPRAA